jgi:trehalose 6-phosphate synthase
VLVLSRFAGAAVELDGALIVNPYDTEGVAEAMQQAITMPLNQRQERWRSMFDVLERNDVDRWRETYLAALADTPVPSRSAARVAQA